MGFLEESCEIFDNQLSFINVNFTNELTTYIESCDVNFDMILTEKKKEHETFTIKLNKFFAKIITAFQSFKLSVQLEIDKRVRSNEFQNNLRKLHAELKNGKKNGVQQVEVHDIWAMRDKYLQCVRELNDYGAKFVKVKYKRTDEIDNDITAFNTTMNNYKKELEEVSKKTITVPLSKMLDFVEDEVSGRSKIMESLNDAITVLQKMQNDCDVLERRKEILGPDVIPKHIGFLKRIALSISNFFRTWAIKIITTVVLIIG